MQNSSNLNNRSNSLNVLKHARNHVLQTLAQKNLVSFNQPKQKYFLNCPLRILLPDFFNIPKFIDKQIDFLGIKDSTNGNNNTVDTFKQEKGLKNKLKDLSTLAEGMKRAKNIREESRYYFIQGVILHNFGVFQKSIQMFDKFLKIVLFIKDDKSVQLALNSIAIGYMYLNSPKQALKYNEKQYSLNENSEKFIGYINMALCNQMMKNKAEAHKIYNQVASDLENLSRKKTQFIYKLQQRTKPHQTENHFMTENQSNNLNSSPKKKFIGISKIKQNINRVRRNHSPPKETESQRLDNSFQKKRYLSDRVNFAIFNAEQNLHSYLKDMRNSFTVDI